jgi:hypothetical protein
MRKGSTWDLRSGRIYSLAERKGTRGAVVESNRIAAVASYEARCPTPTCCWDGKVSGREDSTRQLLDRSKYSSLGG